MYTPIPVPASLKEYKSFEFLQRDLRVTSASPSAGSLHGGQVQRCSCPARPCLVRQRLHETPHFLAAAHQLGTSSRLFGSISPSLTHHVCMRVQGTPQCSVLTVQHPGYSVSRGQHPLTLLSLAVLGWPAAGTRRRDARQRRSAPRAQRQLRLLARRLQLHESAAAARRGGAWGDEHAKMSPAGWSTGIVTAAPPWDITRAFARRQQTFSESCV